MLLGKIEQWKLLVTISPSRGTIITRARPKKRWQHIFLCFIARCIFDLDEANHVDMMLSCKGVINLMLWTLCLVKMKLCDLKNITKMSPATAVFKGSSSRLSANCSISKSWKCVGEMPLTLLKSRKLALCSSWYKMRSPELRTELWLSITF